MLGFNAKVIQSGFQVFFFIHEVDPMDELCQSEFLLIGLFATLPKRSRGMAHRLAFSLFTRMQVNATYSRHPSTKKSGN